MIYPCQKEAGPAGLQAHIVGCPICREFALALAIASERERAYKPDRDWPDALELLCREFNQIGAAKRIEVDKQTVHNWLKGKRTPDRPRQLQIIETVRSAIGNNWRDLR